MGDCYGCCACISFFVRGHLILLSAQFHFSLFIRSSHIHQASVHRNNYKTLKLLSWADRILSGPDFFPLVAAQLDTNCVRKMMGFALEFRFFCAFGLIVLRPLCVQIFRLRNVKLFHTCEKLCRGISHFGNSIEIQKKKNEKKEKKNWVKQSMHSGKRERTHFPFCKISCAAEKKSENNFLTFLSHSQ